MSGTHAVDDRLLTFEVSGSLFALPIAGVLEVAEAPGDFGRWLRAGARRPSQPTFVRELRLLELEGELGPEHFYALDDHLRPSGHERIAKAILELMRSWEKTPPTPR